MLESRIHREREKKEHDERMEDKKQPTRKRSVFAMECHCEEAENEKK